ncbi:MAG: DsbE family thiol:disulfide interchange protein [Candidatus Pelagibacter sp.]|nr:DsbE family thiol:disulfide interchange protein [Candidatus Pelagibacter sp.]OUT95751.1 MAG: hypothetical protein CBB96_03325 [Gammaproteobacteria bacterium TMED36]|tara:strand:+ start:3595 stop:4119 length:525 start_codon:yes stop_codon:yes gene_type:complete
MKRNILFLSLLGLLFFFGLIFYNGLYVEKKYSTKHLIGNELPNFNLISLKDSKVFLSNDDLKDNKFTLINFFASWCAPCRKEHPYLMKLSRINSLEIYGINFKDKKKQAQSFLKKNGNPYKKIGLDYDGSQSINLGAYAVPETILVNNLNKILLKYIGPINEDDYNEIINLIED